jgi:hypothetical protein
MPNVLPRKPCFINIDRYYKMNALSIHYNVDETLAYADLSVCYCGA